MGVCFGIRANRIADGLSVWEGGKSAQSRNSQVAACSTWVYKEASSFHLGMGEEERSGKKVSIFAPKASQKPRFDLRTYTGKLECGRRCGGGAAMILEMWPRPTTSHITL